MPHDTIAARVVGRSGEAQDLVILGPALPQARQDLVRGVLGPGVVSPRCQSALDVHVLVLLPVGPSGVCRKGLSHG